MIPSEWREGARGQEAGAFDRLVASIDPEWIETVLNASGSVTVRRRRLPAEAVLWVVLGMALFRDLPIDEVVSMLGLALPGKRGPRTARSAIAQARQRLGEEPLRWLFEVCAQQWSHASARRHAWRGLGLYGVDGTVVRVPDSPENRAHFGDHPAGGDRGVSGYPLSRVVTLTALRSHLLAAVSFGPYGPEQPYAQQLWPEVPDDSLCMLDRGFLAMHVLWGLQSQGCNRHWMTRAKSTTKWRVVERLGEGDELVEMTVWPDARRAHPELPKTLRMRAIAYQRKGFRPQVLLTSLTDPKAWPREEVIALYHERWEMELGYDEVKTQMLRGELTLRSQSPAAVRQEMWGVALAYNLVRLEMEHVADEAGVPPNRISFVMALRLIRDEWFFLAHASPGTIPQRLRSLRADLARYVLPPRRSERAYPRAVKLVMSKYRRKRPVPVEKRDLK